jgi:tetratricopeptide (TPR) repeat protein
MRISSGLKWQRGRVLFATLIVVAGMTGCNKSPQKVREESMARAAAYEQQAQYGNAIIEYKNAIKADPKSAELYSQIGRAYMKTTQYKEAYQAYTQVLQLQPGDVNAQLAIGQIFLSSGASNDALQLAKELVTRQPKLIEARLLLANAYAAKGIRTLAIEELQSLVKDEPNLTAAHINLGMFYAEGAKPELGEAEFRQALLLEPESFDARKALGALYISQNRMTEAEVLYRAAAQNAPNSPEVLLTLADFYALIKRPADSEQIYQRVIGLQHNSAEARFALARFYVTQGRYDDARRLDENISSQDQKFVPARLQLAELAVNTGDWSKAEKQLAPLLIEQKSNPDVQIVQARILLNRRQPQQAIETLEGILKQGNLAAAHFLMGVAYRQTGNLERAKNEMQAAISADPHLTDAYVTLGEMMLNQDQPKIAMQQAPTRVDCLVLAGSAAVNMRDMALAEKLLQAYSQAMPNNADGYNRLGNLRLIQKRYKEATDYFEKSLKVAPRNYGALDGISSLLLLQGNGAGAIQRVQAALAQGEGPELLSLAGKISMEMGNLDAAEDYLKRTLQRSPENYSAYVQLGSLYARRQKVPEAITFFNTAVKMHPSDVGSWTMLGMLYQEMGDLAKAEESYNRALEVEPNAGVAANNLAWLYADKMNDMDKALELARRAKVALPNVPNINDTLGWIYTKRHLNEMAVPLLMEAVKAEPKQAEYHYHLAVALMQSGKKAAARGEMTSAVRLNGDLRQRSQANEILQ